MFLYKLTHTGISRNEAILLELLHAQISALLLSSSIALSDAKDHHPDRQHSDDEHQRRQGNSQHVDHPVSVGFKRMKKTKEGINS